mgnify:CR=1 FL=1
MSRHVTPTHKRKAMTETETPMEEAFARKLRVEAFVIPFVITTIVNSDIPNEEFNTVCALLSGPPSLP